MFNWVPNVSVGGKLSVVAIRIFDVEYQHINNNNHYITPIIEILNTKQNEFT